MWDSPCTTFPVRDGVFQPIASGDDDWGSMALGKATFTVIDFAFLEYTAIKLIDTVILF